MTNTNRLRDEMKSDHDDDHDRVYEIRDSNGWWKITSRPSTLHSDVEVSVRDGDWSELGETWWWSGRVSCEEDGTDESVGPYAIEPGVPRCRKGKEHDWQSPHEVVGGITENPGVQGHGGGVLITEVCAHCGRYRHTDTWAQCSQTGRQGLTSICYADADQDSLDWIARRDERITEVK